MTNNNNRLDRIEASLELLTTSLTETKQLVESVARTALANSESLKETRQLVESVASTAQANSEAIGELRQERQATDRQIAQLTRDIGTLVSPVRNHV